MKLCHEETGLGLPLAAALEQAEEERLEGVGWAATAREPVQADIAFALAARRK